MRSNIFVVMGVSGCGKSTVVPNIGKPQLESAEHTPLLLARTPFHDLKTLTIDVRK
ncbi:MAG: hypothetical protein GZ093_18710 [Rhodoferax sp.]|nr:hypothetical protein [Rhodoferax sp.]